MKSLILIPAVLALAFLLQPAYALQTNVMHTISTGFQQLMLYASLLVATVLVLSIHHLAKASWYSKYKLTR